MRRNVADKNMVLNFWPRLHGCAKSADMEKEMSAEIIKLRADCRTNSCTSSFIENTVAGIIRNLLFVYLNMDGKVGSNRRLS